MNDDMDCVDQDVRRRTGWRCSSRWTITVTAARSRRTTCICQTTPPPGQQCCTLMVVLTTTCSVRQGASHHACTFSSVQFSIGISITRKSVAFHWYHERKV